MIGQAQDRWKRDPACAATRRLDGSGDPFERLAAPCRVVEGPCQLHRVDVVATGLARKRDADGIDVRRAPALPRPDPDRRTGEARGDRHRPEILEAVDPADDQPLVGRPRIERRPLSELHDADAAGSADRRGDGPKGIAQLAPIRESFGGNRGPDEGESGLDLPAEERIWMSGPRRERRDALRRGPGTRRCRTVEAARCPVGRRVAACHDLHAGAGVGGSDSRGQPGEAGPDDDDVSGWHRRRPSYHWPRTCRCHSSTRRPTHRARPRRRASDSAPRTPA